MRKLILLLALLVVPTVHAQLANTSYTNGAGAPGGACVSGSLYTNSTDGSIYTCTSSAWVIRPSGTVTSIATTAPVGGGTITGTGTLTCTTCTTNAAALTSNAVVLGGGGQAAATNTAFTTNGTTTLTIGVGGGGNGILALSGTTSGTATLTAPSTAGTTTNAVASSNVLSAPAGAVATVAYQTREAGTGLYSDAAASATIAANGVNRWRMATIGGASFVFTGALGNLGWSSNADVTAANCDTGLSRDVGATVAIGNCTLGNNSGTLEVANYQTSGKHTLIASTAPTIASGCNTSGFSVAAANGPGSFVITAGTGTGTSTCVLTLPAAFAGWDCFATNRTRADHIQQTSADSTTSVTLTNYGTGFAATNFTNSDSIQVSCFGH